MQSSMVHSSFGTMMLEPSAKKTFEKLAMTFVSRYGFPSRNASAIFRNDSGESGVGSSTKSSPWQEVTAAARKPASRRMGMRFFIFRKQR